MKYLKYIFLYTVSSLYCFFGYAQEKDIRFIIDLQSYRIVPGDTIEAKIYINKPEGTKILDISPDKGILTKDSINGVYTLKYQDLIYNESYSEPKTIALSGTFFLNNKITKKDTIVSYWVAKPFFVLSGDIRDLFLYKAVENELLIRTSAPRITPAVLKYKCSGAVCYFNKNNTLSIVPDSISDVVTLDVYKDSLLISTYEFNVKDMPIPKIVAYGNRFEAIEKIHLSDSLKEIKLRVIQDELFRTCFPKESQFYIEKVEYLIYRRGKVVAKDIITYENQDCIIPLNLHRQDDYLYIKPILIKRRNYKREKVPFNNVADLVIPID